MGEESSLTNETIVEFEDKKPFNLGLFLVWVTFVVTLIFTLFFWFSANGLKSQVVDKDIEKAELLDQINSDSYIEVANRAEAVKVAVTTLTAIADERISTKELLDQIYAVTTNDVKITSIALGADKTMIIDGKTATYRQVADLMLAMKSYKRVSNLSLVSVSTSNETATSNNQKVVFSISFNINLDKTDG